MDTYSEYENKKRRNEITEREDRKKIKKKREEKRK
jgi:hypothetical protein